MKDLKIHYSLLPAYKNSDDPVRDAFLDGVKVTGVTIALGEKIVAQYPIFVTNEMHYDELKIYLEHIAEIMFPLVQEKLEKNEAFEIQTLMGAKKCGSCSTCGGCNSVSSKSCSHEEEY